MTVAFTFDVLPRTPRYVLQLKCPIFTYACHHGNKISEGYFGGRNSRMSLFILPY